MDIKKVTAAPQEWGEIFTFVDKNINEGSIEAGIFKCEPGKSLEKHTHKDAYEYCYILNGRGIFVIEDNKYEVNSGEVIKIPQNVEHYSYNTEDEAFTCAYLVCP